MAKLGTVVLCGLFCLRGAAFAQQGYGLHPLASLADYRHSVSLDSNQALVPLDHVLLDIRYATSQNIMHRPVYSEARAFLRLPAARALDAVESALKPLGYGLKVYDGYRPYRVTVAFWERYHDSTFVASPYTGSRHNQIGRAHV